MGVNELMGEIAGIGRNPATGGYNRFAFTDVDRQLRQWFLAKAEQRGLEVESDDNANLWAWWGDPGGKAVATGSHLDSVPDGGAFDGPLGIASAFAAVDLLRIQGHKPTHSIAVVAFSEEEGARFGVPCLGSRLLTGDLEPSRARSLVDRSGTSLAEAMSAAGLDPMRIGPDPERVARIECFVELHVEQGRGLVDLESPIGLATGIWPHGRWRLDFAARSDHAGTTRMDDRLDPIPVFARTVSAVTDAATRLGARATFGRLEVEPNATNAIPSVFTAWLDLRAENIDQLSSLIELVESDGITEESYTEAIEFHPPLRDQISTLLRDPPHLATAAGHDAGILSLAGISTAMIFVRNPTGASHTPREHAPPQDCEEGVQALAKVLRQLTATA